MKVHLESVLPLQSGLYCGLTVQIAGLASKKFATVVIPWEQLDNEALRRITETRDRAVRRLWEDAQYELDLE